MRIAVLADAASIHTVKWCNALVERGHEVHLITLHDVSDLLKDNVFVHRLRYAPPWGYYTNFMILRGLLSKIKPALLHTHYASGYGTLARLADYHPNILSVWGSDVYIFPYTSRFALRVLQANLKAADYLTSTSQALKDQVLSLYIPRKPIEVIPFGVDTDVFRPLPKEETPWTTIGMIKRMEPKYGPQYLIEAFYQLVKKYPFLRLLMIGGGSSQRSLISMTKKLGLSDRVTFIGSVPHTEVVRWMNNLDIYCAPSISESFGVAILEASACGLPVVTSNVGGLPEVVKDGITGFIVPPKDVSSLVNAIERLITNHRLRKEMGVNGREFVKKVYQWHDCVNKLEHFYSRVTNINY